jgi:hypothetical protein
MCDVFGWFSPTDLFAFGLGMDFVGAFLLGRGLLMTPSELVRRWGQSRNNFAVVYLGEMEDRVDGVFGVGALVTGFTLQAIGYALLVGGVSNESRRLGGAIVAVVCAIGAGGLVFAAWRVLRFRYLVRLLCELARHDWTERYDHPDATELARYAVILGLARHPGVEDNVAYVRRVFGIKTPLRERSPSGQWVTHSETSS